MPTGHVQSEAGPDRVLELHGGHIFAQFCSNEQRDVRELQRDGVLARGQPGVPVVSAVLRGGAGEQPDPGLRVHPRVHGRFCGAVHEVRAGQVQEHHRELAVRVVLGEFVLAVRSDELDSVLLQRRLSRRVRAAVCGVRNRQVQGRVQCVRVHRLPGQHVRGPGRHDGVHGVRADERGTDRRYDHLELHVQRRVSRPDVRRSDSSRQFRKVLWTAAAGSVCSDAVEHVDDPNRRWCI